jgi:hypothetical protein
MRRITTEKGSIEYLNSGDWIENLTALEYHDGAWSLFRFAESGLKSDPEGPDPDASQLFSEMLAEFKLLKTQ